MKNLDDIIEVVQNLRADGNSCEYVDGFYDCRGIIMGELRDLQTITKNYGSKQVYDARVSRVKRQYDSLMHEITAGAATDTAIIGAFYLRCALDELEGYDG